MSKLIAFIIVALLGVTVAACGQEDLGGYATAEAAAQDAGCTLVPGQIVEADEVERKCLTNPNDPEDKSGYIVEAPKDAVRGQYKNDYANPWLVDEDSRLCKDGQEADGELGQRCGPNGVIDPGGQGAVVVPGGEIED